MSIVCGAVNTGAALHGSIKTTPWEFTRTVNTFFGVVGEQHIHGRLHGRNLIAMLHLSGYATHTALQTAVSDLNALIGTAASVVWTVGADITTYTFCTFEGFELDEDPWYDGSGINGWQVSGQLKFRQIKQ